MTSAPRLAAVFTAFLRLAKLVAWAVGLEAEAERAGKAPRTANIPTQTTRRRIMIRFLSQRDTAQRGACSLDDRPPGTPCTGASVLTWYPERGRTKGGGRSPLL